MWVVTVFDRCKNINDTDEDNGVIVKVRYILTKYAGLYLGVNLNWYKRMLEVFLLIMEIAFDNKLYFEFAEAC